MTDSKDCNCFDDSPEARAGRERRLKARREVRDLARTIVAHAALLVKGMRVRDVGRIMAAAHAYLHAAITGNVATDEERAAQRAACAACESRVDVTVRGKSASYCGEPFVDHIDADPPTCGCPIDGIALTSPAFKSCPQGKLPAA